MTVRELRDRLATFPDEHLVLCSIDEEGNGFNRIIEVTDGVYNHTWREFFSHPDDIRGTHSPINAVCVWP